MTVQLYVPTFMEPAGPLVLSHATPETPAICQLAVPVGVAPAIGPVTVALKVNVEPNDAVGESVVTEIDGLNFETTIVDEKVGPADVKLLSPG